MKINSTIKLKAVITVPIFLALLYTLFFLVAGSINFPFVWVYAALHISNALIGVLLINPDLMAERMSRKKDAKKWDIVFNRLYGIFIILFLVFCALDAGRLHLSPLIPVGFKIGALILLVLSMAWSDWAVATNKFFSRLVRIQHDRGHYVIDKGPYQFIRHPAYVSILILSICMPILLGSLWSLLFSIPLIALVVWRTIKEDRALHDELAGYTEYARRVRYRLVPGLF